jgi:hypothetical protein
MKYEDDEDWMRTWAAILGVGMVSAWATGCGSSVYTPPGGGAAVDQLLAPDATGKVDLSATETTGIQGQWHAYADDRFGVPAGHCQTTAYGECSIVSEPAPGEPFAPTAGLGMCTSGIIARWIAGSAGITPDGSPGSGGIVLELGTTGQSYDAVAHGVTGFAFDIDSEPAPGAGLMVQVASEGPARSWPDPTPAYWGGTRLDASPVHAGHNEFAWKDVGPSPFYPTGMLRIGFVVSGNDSQAVGYAFCINNLTALRSVGVVGPPPDSDGQLLVPDPSGWVAMNKTGTTHIQGPWFATSDGVVPPGSCQQDGHADTECSFVSEPDPATTTFPPTKDLGMCTSGVVAKAVGTDGITPDYNIWGAEIVFQLNNSGSPGGGGGGDPYDADRYGVTGFGFDIDSEPPPGAEIQVALTTLGTGTSPASWGGQTAKWSPVHAGHNEFRWNDVGGPLYQTNPPPLDRKHLIQIGFMVQSNQDHAVGYSFCINNLTALRH